MYFNKQIYKYYKNKAYKTVNLLVCHPIISKNYNIRLKGNIKNTCNFELLEINNDQRYFIFIFSGIENHLVKKEEKDKF